MNQRTFELKVDSLAGAASRKPRLYKVKVMLLALFGYSVLFFTMIGSLFIGLAWVWGVIVSGAIITLRLAWIPFVLAYMVFSNLRVKIPKPAGRELSPAEAPLLFDDIERIRHELKAKKIHHVILDEGYNAGICHVPRLGILGWPCNYLLIGMQFAMAHTPEQFEVVLAHEMGHLSSSQSRFAAWIYRVRGSWSQLMDELDKGRGWLTYPLRKFFDVYAPVFAAYSFVMVRAHEYDADQASARVAGTAVVAEQLTNTAVRQDLIVDPFWSDYWSNLEADDEPPVNAFSRLKEDLKKELSEQDSALVLRNRLASTTGAADTHPCLADRLDALGGGIANFTTLNESAAERFFGKNLDSMIEEIESEWRHTVMPFWTDEHNGIVANREKLEGLEEKGIDSLNEDELEDFVMLSYERYKPDRRLSVYRYLVERHPGYWVSHLALGRVLVEAMDEEGVICLKRAMQIEPLICQTVRELLFDFYIASGKEDEAVQCREQWQKRDEEITKALAERQDVCRKDRFLHHGLNPIELGTVIRQLRMRPSIKKAYVVRKDLEYDSDQPLHVLGVKVAGSKKKQNKMLDELAEIELFPWYSYIIILGRGHPAERRMKKIKDSRIY